MGNAVVDSQLHHFGVHHDETDLFGAGLVQQRNNQGVGTHRLTGTGGTGDEQVGQLCDVAHDAVAADVLTHGEGHLGGAVLELVRAEHRADVYGRDQLIGHLDAHHGDLVGNGGDTYAGGAQGQGDVVGQVGQLVQPDALVQLQLIPGHRGAAGHVHDVGVDTEGVDGVAEPLLVGVELHQGFAAQLALPFGQQGQGRIVVRGNYLLHPGLNVLGHLLGRLDGLLPAGLGGSGFRGRRLGRTLLEGCGGGRGGGRRPEGGHHLRLHRRGRKDRLLLHRSGSGLLLGLGRGSRNRLLPHWLFLHGLLPHRLDRLHRSGGGLLRRGGGSGRRQQLIGGRHPGLAVEEAPLPLGLGLLRLGLLAHQGAIVHRNINGRTLAGLGHSLSATDRLFHFTFSVGQLFQLILVPGTAEDPVGHIHNGAVEGTQAQQQEQQHENHRGAHAAEDLNKALGNDAGDDAAAVHGLAVLPKGRDQGAVPGQGPSHQSVDHTGQHPGQHQGAGQAQAHRPASMEGQDVAGQQQGRRHQPEAVAKQSLQHRAEEVDENGLDVEVAKGGKHGQQEADHRPHLSAEGFPLGLLDPLFPGRRGSRTALSPGLGRGGSLSLPSGRFGAAGAAFLLCHNRAILSRKSGTVRGAPKPSLITSTGPAGPMENANHSMGKNVRCLYNSTPTPTLPPFSSPLLPGHKKPRGTA